MRYAQQDSQNRLFWSRASKAQGWPRVARRRPVARPGARAPGLGSSLQGQARRAQHVSRVAKGKPPARGLARGHPPCQASNKASPAPCGQARAAWGQASKAGLGSSLQGLNAAWPCARGAPTPPRAPARPGRSTPRTARGPPSAPGAGMAYAATTNCRRA